MSWLMRSLAIAAMALLGAALREAEAATDGIDEHPHVIGALDPDRVARIRRLLLDEGVLLGTSIVPDAFDERERPALVRWADRASRYVDQLALKLDDGRHLILKNRSAEWGGFNCCRSYRLREFVEVIPAYVVFADFHEDHETLLISATDGRILRLPGSPVFDQRHARFVAVNEDWPFGPLEISVWQREGDWFRELYRCRDPGTPFDTAAWVTDDEIHLRPPVEAHAPRRLMKRDGRWALDGCRD